jgi:hypothetical protein
VRACVRASCSVQVCFVVVCGFGGNRRCQKKQRRASGLTDRIGSVQGVLSGPLPRARSWRAAAHVLRLLSSRVPGGGQEVAGQQGAVDTLLAAAPVLTWLRKACSWGCEAGSTVASNSGTKMFSSICSKLSMMPCGGRLKQGPGWGRCWDQDCAVGFQIVCHQGAPLPARAATGFAGVALRLHSRASQPNQPPQPVHARGRPEPAPQQPGQSARARWLSSRVAGPGDLCVHNTQHAHGCMYSRPPTLSTVRLHHAASQPPPTPKNQTQTNPPGLCRRCRAAESGSATPRCRSTGCCPPPMPPGCPIPRACGRTR